MIKKTSDRDTTNLQTQTMRDPVGVETAIFSSSSSLWRDLDTLVNIFRQLSLSPLNGVLQRFRIVCPLSWGPCERQEK